MADMRTVKQLIRSAGILYQQPQFRYTRDEGMVFVAASEKPAVVKENRKAALKRMRQGLEQFSKLKEQSKIKLLHRDAIVATAALAVQATSGNLLSDSVMCEMPDWG